MKTAGLPLSPRGYSKLEGRRNQRRNEKGFFVSPHGDSIVPRGDVNLCPDIERLCHRCLVKAFSSRVVVRPPVPDDEPT